MSKLSKREKNEQRGILVSEEDIDLLEKYSWYINGEGSYIRGYVDGVSWTLHRYIMIERLNNNVTNSYVVDHVDGNPRNNNRCNLRIVTPAENARNTRKQSGTSSVYFGVCKTKNNKFQVTIKRLKLYALYEQESWAAWTWNLWIDRYGITFSPKNDIQAPENFVEHVKKEKVLPNNITYVNSQYNVSFKGIQLGKYNTLDEATTILSQTKEKIEQERIVNILKEPIMRNADGIAFLERRGKQILIDDDIYYELVINNRITIGAGGYAFINIDDVDIRLHRYIMKYNGEDVVDHINNNRLDNRKSNLRIVTRNQNAQNRQVVENTSSSYIGVYWNDRRKVWYSTIYQQKFLGSFKDEIEAAIRRDKATLQYMPVFGNLNFPLSKDLMNDIHNRLR